MGKKTRQLFHLAKELARRQRRSGGRPRSVRRVLLPQLPFLLLRDDVHRAPSIQSALDRSQRSQENQASDRFIKIHGGRCQIDRIHPHSTPISTQGSGDETSESKTGATPQRGDYRLRRLNSLSVKRFGGRKPLNPSPSHPFSPPRPLPSQLATSNQPLTTNPPVRTGSLQLIKHREG